ncbi:MAG: translation initiation factor IF-2 [Gammaproteobacteria bacterium]|nr:translation initiation factor IF-2 [Gammaproteobacteria bacterium]
MSDVTVSQFAEVLKVPVDRLLIQLEKAGIKVAGADDSISDDSKMELLTFLRKSHGQDADNAAMGPRKISLKRKSHTELRLPGPQGRARTVSVEVRRKRTYVKRDDLEKEAKAKQAELDKIRAEELAEKSRQEEEIRARAESREEQRTRQEQEESERIEKERSIKEADAGRRVEEELKRQQEASEKERQEKEKKHREHAARAERDRKRSRTKYGREELHVGSLSARRKRKPQRRRPSHISVDQHHGFEMPTEPVVREVKVPETISVGELGKLMAIKSGELIKALMGMGVMATINQVLDQDTALLLVEELGHKAISVSENHMEEKLVEAAGESEAEELPRSPVVTVMGHVDHGKTSLLDHIRKSRVAAGEAGGITQHIGAYSVETKKGTITFLDTPGHEAFTAMRARGARATDIVILVVAADDGVMPQTIEAIQHAKVAGVSLVVAVNKIDKPEADVEKVRNELSQHEVISEEWGGEHLFANVSATSGEGIDQLLDIILLQAEVLELKARREGPATGIVIESRLERGRGPVATVLVKKGTLRSGDILLAGQELGRVRAMFDHAGKAVTEAGPSIPVEVLGLSGTPAAGDDTLVVSSERKAREIADLRRGRSRDVDLASQQAARLDDVFTQMEAGLASSVQILIKADVHGSAEAIRDALGKLPSDEVKVKIIGSTVGGITESDVHLAAASGAIILGFNVRADSAARKTIQEMGVDVRYYSVIYEAIDDVKDALSGLLTPEIREQMVGLAEVREVFKSPSFGQIAGCLVTEGAVRRNNPIRVLRDNVVIYEGELESLRRFKDDANEVRSGTECGIGVRNYNDVKVGDQIECYERIEVARTLE